MNFIENITFRRKRAKSTEDIPEITNHTLDGTSSMPDISTYTNEEQIGELKEQLETLKLELQSAHEEVQNLTIENNSLKNTIKDLTKRNEMFKSVTNTLKHDLITPKKNTTNKTSTPLQHSKKTIKQTINKQDYRPIDKSIKKTFDPAVNTNNNNLKRKLCIISSNNKNKILSIAEEHFSEQFQICHYCKPNAGVKELLKNIESKIEKYSEHDYCLILIGESDFVSTDDYLKLIYHIRNRTQLITHTNIIFCLPTYRYKQHSELFNWRVETFNNLLYLDITTNEHAYVFDSNEKLSYNFDMYTKYGHLNNYGMNTIFKDINSEISKLDMNLIENKTGTSKETNFFLI